MNQESHAELLRLAVEAARTAGAHALNNTARRNDVVALTAHDVKLQLDVECQKIAESIISRRFPEHGFIGEENGVAQPLPGKGYHWIVDPIDGTVNFNFGFSYWCCSVAVMHDTAVVAGAVFAPEIDELYTATVDEAAHLNGRPIRVSDRTDIAQALMYMGTGGNNPDMPAAFKRMQAVSERVRKIRIMGSAALDICRVARGQGDGYFEDGVYLWDTAAAGLILRQAGGRTEDLTTHPTLRQRYLATNGHTHEALRVTLQPYL